MFMDAVKEKYSFQRRKHNLLDRLQLCAYLLL